MNDTEQVCIVFGSGSTLGQIAVSQTHSTCHKLSTSDTICSLSSTSTTTTDPIEEREDQKCRGLLEAKLCS
jgi:hypothetical protein